MSISILNRGASGGLKPELTVAAPSGSTIDLLQNGLVVDTYTLGASETEHTFAVKVGTYTVRGTLGEDTAESEVVIDTVGQYQHKVEYVTLLGELAVGDVVKVNVNGADTDFIIVHQGLPSALYDSSCEGTWLLRSTLEYGTNVRFNGGDSRYKNGSLDTYMTYTFLPKLTAEMQAAIKTARIPYFNGYGGVDHGSAATGANGYDVKVFALSAYEVGATVAGNSITGSNNLLAKDGDCLSYFSTSTDSRRATTGNGSADNRWWTRSPSGAGARYAYLVYGDGRLSSLDGNSYQYSPRPAFILPSDIAVNKDGTLAV